MAINEKNGFFDILKEIILKYMKSWKKPKKVEKIPKINNRQHSACQKKIQGFFCPGAIRMSKCTILAEFYLRYDL